MKERTAFQKYFPAVMNVSQMPWSFGAKQQKNVYPVKHYGVNDSGKNYGFLIIPANH